MTIPEARLEAIAPGMSRPDSPVVATLRRMTSSTAAARHGVSPPDAVAAIQGDTVHTSSSASTECPCGAPRATSR